MDLFSITCTTCKSRLKVREQAAIGQILACPKCGGMVMVKPPPNWSAGAAENADLPTATEVVSAAPPLNQTIHNSAFEALDELLSDAPPRIRPPSAASPQATAPPGSAPPAPPATASPSAPRSATPKPSATPPSATPSPTKPRFVEGPRVISKARSATPSPESVLKPSAPPSSAANMPPSPPPPSASPSPVNGARQPPAKDSAPLAPPPPAEHEPGKTPAKAASPYRFWLLTTGSVVIGVVLAFLAVTGAIRFLRGPSAARAIFKATSPKTGDKEDQPAGPTTAPLPDDSSPTAPAAESPSPETTSPDAAPPLAVSPPASASADSKNSPPAPATDPVGIASAPQSLPDAKAAKADSLAKFDRLIGGNNEDPLSKLTTGAPPAAVPPPADDAAPVRPVAPRPPPRDIDLAKRLADPLPAIETAGTPLADFLQVISDLSTIPITLEPDALPIVNASAATPVVVNISNSTTGVALSAALKPLNLEAIESDGQLIVRTIEPAPMRTQTFPAKDLAPDEESLQPLAETLKALVEPASWGDSPEQPSMAVDAKKGTIAIHHTRAVHAQLLLACEKLRNARGLKPLSRIDPAHFKLDTRAARALAHLETPVSLNYSQPTRLTVIFDRLGELAGARIIVDWRDIAAAGWNPAGEATLVTSRQPLSAALDALLAPLDLTWRVIDGQTLQVVTPARLAEQTEIELYKVTDLLGNDPSGEALLSKFRDALGEGAFRDAGGNGELRFDELGQCLLASLPQPKQRELEALLAKWRAEIKK
jgi:DNA-directed RNA polymerase subunit RPC12/RpoP